MKKVFFILLVLGMSRNTNALARNADTKARGISLAYMHTQ